MKLSNLGLLGPYFLHSKLYVVWLSYTKFDHSSYLKFFCSNIIKFKLFLKNLYWHSKSQQKKWYLHKFLNKMSDQIWSWKSQTTYNLEQGSRRLHFLCVFYAKDAFLITKSAMSNLYTKTTLAPSYNGSNIMENKHKSSL